MECCVRIATITLSVKCSDPFGDAKPQSPVAVVGRRRRLPRRTRALDRCNENVPITDKVSAPLAAFERAVSRFDCGILAARDAAIAENSSLESSSKGILLDIAGTMRLLELQLAFTPRHPKRCTAP